MNGSSPSSRLRRGIGWLMLGVGAAVFLIRLQHPGPYDFPEGGNLLAGVLALGIGAGLAGRRLAKPLTWLALAASPIVLFFALYAIFAELEEVVVLKTADRAGRPADLRLWIVDHDDAEWVTMPRAKADAHGLTRARVELQRDGTVRCVIATRHEDRATVNEIHRLRHEKYAVQRLATALGLFGRAAGEETVALRLASCPVTE